jgi:4-oxalmesaconate hydratase
MIIDCHAHYTSEPKSVPDFRARQIKAFNDKTPWPTRKDLKVSDDEIRAGIDSIQLKYQHERGIDRTIFSPRASAMGHHLTDEKLSLEWTQISNEFVHRIVGLYPNDFIGAAQLPQVVGVRPDNCVRELERCVNEYGFVGCNLNPDPSGGFFNSPPLTDPWWYPIFEKMCELDVPGMIHVSGCCNPSQYTTSSYYINGDTTAFVQLIMVDLFAKFPTLKLIIPHGGGAIPYHWGRFRGIAFMNGRPELTEIMGNNIFVDTCVYHQPGIDFLTDIVPVDNILFASELWGAVKGLNPDTGREFDDTKHYVENSPRLTAADRAKIFEGNARRVFPRINKVLATAKA